MQKYASVGFLALSLLFWLLIFLYSFVLADCVGMSKFQKGYSKTDSCVFLRAENRSKAQVILSNIYQSFWQVMQNISRL